MPSLSNLVRGLWKPLRKAGPVHLFLVPCTKQKETPMTTEPTEKHREEAREIGSCPFCPHGIGFIRNESGRYNGVVWVECDWPSHAVRLTAGNDAIPPCGAKTAEYQTEEEAVKAWNTRVASRDAEVREVLEGLMINAQCWCRVNREGHTADCLAARALYESLQPVKEGKDDQR